ncbi:hypothetical protein B0H14DRAFT_2619197 [Mycena olivaceomarginata]|nr:hypothetical protein B0H14DRAFT_2619197 [Mycena olivaceomarginata]
MAFSTTQHDPTFRPAKNSFLTVGKNPPPRAVQIGKIFSGSLGTRAATRGVKISDRAYDQQHVHGGGGAKYLLFVLDSQRVEPTATTAVYIASSLGVNPCTSHYRENVHNYPSFPPPPSPSPAIAVAATPSSLTAQLGPLKCPKCGKQFRPGANEGTVQTHMTTSKTCKYIQHPNVIPSSQMLGAIPDPPLRPQPLLASPNQPCAAGIPKPPSQQSSSTAWRWNIYDLQDLQKMTQRHPERCLRVILGGRGVAPEARNRQDKFDNVRSSRHFEEDNSKATMHIVQSDENRYKEMSSYEGPEVARDGK